MSLITPSTIRSFLDHVGPIDLKAYEHRPIAYKTYDLADCLKSATVLNERDPKLPEYEPYHLEAIEEGQQTSWQKFSRKAKACKNSAARFFRHTLQRVQDYFVENQFDLLMSIGAQRNVRVSATYLWPAKHESLYGLSSWCFSQWLGINALYQLYKEGVLFARSPLANVAKIAELAPRIIVNKAKEVQQNFEHRIEPYLRQAAAVLSDDHYENREFLEHLWNKLFLELTLFREEATDLELENDKFGATQMKEMQKSIGVLFDEGQNNSTFLVYEPKWYSINELKVYLAKFLKKGGKFSEAVQEGLEKQVLINGKSKQPTSTERLRENIAVLVRNIDALKKQTEKQVKEMAVLLDFFESGRGHKESL